MTWGTRISPAGEPQRVLLLACTITQPPQGRRMPYRVLSRAQSSLLKGGECPIASYRVHNHAASSRAENALQPSQSMASRRSRCRAQSARAMTRRRRRRPSMGDTARGALRRLGEEDTARARCSCGGASGLASARAVPWLDTLLVPTNTHRSDYTCWQGPAALRGGRHSAGAADPCHRSWGKLCICRRRTHFSGALVGALDPGFAPRVGISVAENSREWRFRVAACVAGPDIAF